MTMRFLWRAWKARFHDQRTEIRELTASLRAGDFAVDVGANKGSYLYWLSRAVGETGTAYAFEPQPVLAEYLRKECARLGNVVIEAAGVSDRAGELTLHVPHGGASPGASFEQSILQHGDCTSYAVPVVTLDEYFQSRKRRIAALKIDTEGHELSVLRGARGVLQEDAPCLIMECEARHVTTGSVSDVLQFLESLGYRGSFVNQGRMCPMAEFDPARHQRQHGERFWDAKDYCNNFVLRRRAA